MTCNRHVQLALGAICLILAAVSPASAEWKEKVLYSFQGGSDGQTPAGGVVFDKAGNLYGANTWGGDLNCLSEGCGTVFQVSPPSQKGGSWTETVLHAFHGPFNGAGDGFNPSGGTIIDAQGNLYGTTSLGGNGPCILLGSHVGCGTVYELSPPMQKGGPWTETILYNFQGGTDGYLPLGDLVFDKNGNLYGATDFGGGKGTTCNPYYGGNCGTVFKLSPPKEKGGTWTEKVLYSFPGGPAGRPNGDGAQPNGGLVLDSKGALYGTTYYGGNEAGDCDGGSAGVGCGTVFRITPSSKKGGAWTEKVLHRFDIQDGDNPKGGLILDGAGSLYSTTSGGPQDKYGLVFELQPPSGKSHPWTEIVLYFFTDRNDGAYPAAGLTFDANGNLYGTAIQSESGGGGVFRLRPPKKKGATWSPEVIHDFTGPPDGAIPTAALLIDRADTVYSTTQIGGTGACSGGGCGTVFEASP
jgi:hypothetical protein